ncbi:MAG: helix-turn-helix domain-containing protein [Candidatus Bathyarchaeia archaeon]
MEMQDVLLFTRLGLSVTEAKIYLTLLQLGIATAKEVSKSSGIARPDVYRVMETLGQSGLIEKILSVPCKYKAIEVKDAIARLMEKKRKETAEFQDAARTILKKFDSRSDKIILKEDRSQFILMPAGQALIKRIKKAIDEVQTSLDLLLSWNRFAQGVGSSFTKNFEDALARNVKYRFIVENPPAKSTEKLKLLTYVRKSPLCQIKFLPFRPNTIMGIYDKKEISVIVDPAKELPDSPALWTSCLSLITMAQDYFDILWLTAMNQTDHETNQALTKYEL